MIIGITGGSGAGKTTLLQAIARAGGLILDCDAIYHRLLREDPALTGAIEARFPGTVRGGELDRKALGAIVFADEEALKDLNRITHSAVKAEVLRLLKTAPALAAIDAIGLFEGVPFRIATRANSSGLRRVRVRRVQPFGTLAPGS